MSRKVLVALAFVVAMLLVATLGPRGFVVGLATALIPVPIYITMALWLDRNEPEPGALLARSFLWGMLVASLFSIVMNAAAVGYVQVTLGLSALVGKRVGVLLASPVFEELSKGLALFLIFQRQRDEFDDVVDGAIYAAMVGLGFAATENVLYYGNAALHGRLAMVFATRGVASPFAHPLFTAMTGIGFGLARDAANRRIAVPRISAGLAAAITLHVLWNAAATFHLLLPAYAIIMVPTFLAVLLLLRRDLRREQDRLRERIIAERHIMPLTDDEVDMLCSQGRSRTRILRGVRRSAVELAFACWHAECAGQPESPRIAELRAAYIRACEQWRAQN